ncbi:PEP-CTERM sorting domain-containing protein [Cellvibrio sp. KY-YJ-3]|jgi:hypothetical protein|uniref:PEP-CTERM sorting domain-containing protein n=1 Tax=Cellvibrio sp. KY-YJ-3 TaxID=454662 RepID=UPI0012489D87|nr:PEP-CTERM sorting domain-containing protein [Cellvibrio sp. KY-YJ-3]QEY13686.1 PEP-CTERM sorting domain-containing protein [Cellvibrio sp. KY-YJ-3]
MTINNPCKYLFALCVILLAMQSNAVVIDTRYEQVDSNLWTMDLTIHNDQPDQFIHEFTVFFAPELFADLTIVASPFTWDSLVVQPDALLGDGFLDSYSFTGLAFGDALSGFKIAFSYAGFDAPGALDFLVYDADFSPLGEGQTRVVTQAVPESSTLMLLLLGCMALALTRKSKQLATVIV